MKIAIRGVIGSGKTTTSNYIADKYGYTIFNCDDVVHELYDSNVELVNKIEDAFNIDEFSRKGLGNIVFGDNEKLKLLEKIVFPYIIKEYETITDKNVIIDCQIVDKLNIDYDISLICHATKDTIIKRVTNRDNREVAQIEKILKAQSNIYTAKKRTWAVNTEVDIAPQIEKIIGGKNDTNR